MPFDLLIKGGHVLSPGDDLDAIFDIGTSAGRIAAIAPELPIGDAKQAIEIRGEHRHVVPGLIDVHAPSRWGATTPGVGLDCCARAIGMDNEIGSDHSRHGIRTLAVHGYCRTGVVRRPGSGTGARRGAARTELGPHPCCWLPEPAE